MQFIGAMRRCLEIEDGKVDRHDEQQLSKPRECSPWNHVQVWYALINAKSPSQANLRRAPLTNTTEGRTV